MCCDLRKVIPLNNVLSNFDAWFSGRKSYHNEERKKQNIIEIQDDTVKVRLEGACSTCSINQMTLKSGVEMTIKKHAPEIQNVINIES